MYVSLYNWYHMPTSVHKVLLHGADIIDSFELPIGNFSEEAQESRNKDFKRIRANHSRKTSRAHTNEDIIHWLLISSDPVISSIRTTYPKKKKELDLDTTQLFAIE